MLQLRNQTAECGWDPEVRIEFKSTQIADSHWHSCISLPDFKQDYQLKQPIHLIAHGTGVGPQQLSGSNTVLTSGFTFHDTDDVANTHL